MVKFDGPSVGNRFLAGGSGSDGQPELRFSRCAVRCLFRREAASARCCRMCWRSRQAARSEVHKRRIRSELRSQSCSSSHRISAARSRLRWMVRCCRFLHGRLSPKFGMRRVCSRRLRGCSRRPTSSCARIGQPDLVLKQETVNGRTYYSMAAPFGQVRMEVNYVFVDGYLLAGRTATLLDRAMSDRAAGSRSRARRSSRKLLPRDNRRRTYSGMVYQNAGELMQLMADRSCRGSQRDTGTAEGGGGNRSKCGADAGLRLRRERPD